MKIGFFGVGSWEKKIIEKEISRIDSVGIGIFEAEVQDDLELAAGYEVVSTFVHGKLSRDVLEKLPNLKMIATRSTGMDHIDVDYCKEKGIVVCNVESYGSITVAEYTWALILAITKKIIPSKEAVEHMDFHPSGITGVDLFGSTLGVVGVGKIGEEVIKIARGFKMKVLAVEVRHDKDKAERLGYEMVDLETCLRESDILTLHVPSIPQTRHLINKNNITLMKKGAYLINTCRGSVVETSALIGALNRRDLAGAGLDVFEEEGLVEQIASVTKRKLSKQEVAEFNSFKMLTDRDDVIVTPHNAFNTAGAIGRIVATTVENINSYLKNI